jgi:hypothetical protein
LSFWRCDSKNNIYRVNNVVVAANDATVKAGAWFNRKKKLERETAMENRQSTILFSRIRQVFICHAR